MGKKLLTDESWDAARLIIRQFEKRLDDQEIVESFHAVLRIVYSAMERYHEGHELERSRLASEWETQKELCDEGYEEQEEQEQQEINEAQENQEGHVLERSCLAPERQTQNEPDDNTSARLIDTNQCSTPTVDQREKLHLQGITFNTKCTGCNE